MASKQSVPQPRYCDAYKTVAKDQQLPLFCLDFDERHLNGRQYRSASMGVLIEDEAREIVRKLMRFHPQAVKEEVERG